MAFIAVFTSHGSGPQSKAGRVSLWGFFLKSKMMSSFETCDSGFGFGRDECEYTRDGTTLASNETKNH